MYRIDLMKVTLKIIREIFIELVIDWRRKRFLIEEETPK